MHTRRQGIPPLTWGWLAVASVVLVGAAVLALVFLPPLLADDSPAARLEALEEKWGFAAPEGETSIEGEAVGSGPQGDGSTLLEIAYPQSEEDLLAATTTPRPPTELLDCVPVDEALIPFEERRASCDREFRGRMALQLDDGQDRLWVFWHEERVIVLELTT